MDSYQHSYPGERDHLLDTPQRAASVEDVGVVNERRRYSWNLKKLGVVVLLGLLFVTALTALTAAPDDVDSTPDTTTTPALLGSSHHKSISDTTTTTDATEEGPPEPDTKEGMYDWKKCQNSDDPDCWKKEGERVHSYWRDFGQKMKTYWKNFGQKIRNMFSRKGAAPAEAPA